MSFEHHTQITKAHNVKIKPTQTLDINRRAALSGWSGIRKPVLKTLDKLCQSLAMKASAAISRAMQKSLPLQNMITLFHRVIRISLAFSNSSWSTHFFFSPAILPKSALPSWREGMRRATLGSAAPWQHLQASLGRQHFSPLTCPEITSRYSNKWDRCGIAFIHGL